MNTLHRALAAAALAALVLPAAAQVFTIDFDGPAGAGIAKAVPPPDLPPGTGDQFFGSALLGYYNGDPGYERDGRQTWNTTFSPTTLAIGSLQDPNGQGNFPKAHSGLYAAGTVSEPAFDMRVNPGLVVSSLSFWYSAGGTGSNPGLALYAGENLVASVSLHVCSRTVGGFCEWEQYAVAPDQLAGQRITRVAFAGTPNKVVFDDVAVTAVPVPEPATYALMAFGLALVGAAVRRR